MLSLVYLERQGNRQRMSVGLCMRWEGICNECKMRKQGRYNTGGIAEQDPSRTCPEDDDDDECKSNRVVALRQEVQFRWLRDVMTGPPEAELTRSSDCSQLVTLSDEHDELRWFDREVSLC